MRAAMAYPSANLPRVHIRLDENLLARLKSASEASSRPLNAEIVSRLDKSFEVDDRVDSLEHAVELTTRVGRSAALERNMLRERVQQLELEKAQMEEPSDGKMRNTMLITINREDQPAISSIDSLESVIRLMSLVLREMVSPTDGSLPSEIVSISARARRAIAAD